MLVRHFSGGQGFHGKRVNAPVKQCIQSIINEAVPGQPTQINELGADHTDTEMTSLASTCVPGVQVAVILHGDVCG